MEEAMQEKILKISKALCNFWCDFVKYCTILEADNLKDVEHEKPNNNNAPEELQKIFNKAMEEINMEQIINDFRKSVAKALKNSDRTQKEKNLIKHTIEYATTEAEIILHNMAWFYFFESSLFNEYKAEKREAKELQNNIDNALDKSGLQLFAGTPIQNHLKIQALKPETAILNNTKVYNALLKVDEKSRMQIESRISVDKDSKGKTKVIASIDYNNNNVAISGAPLTAFDKTVHNAVCTLAEAHNQYFTVDMVYRAMNGLSNKEDIDGDRRGTLEPIRDSIESMLLKRIKIDCTEQIQAKKHDTERVIFEDYLLPLKKATAVFNTGTEPIECYFLHDMPPLFAYAKKVNQVISADIGLLDSGKVVKNSNEFSVIREYVLKRILIMKNSNNTICNHKILYSTIYSECGINEQELSQTQKNRKRERIKKYIEFLITKKEIKGYKETKSGRAFDGIEIYI